ncbi:gamma-glutamyltransferase [Paenibacillus xylanexedens]|uniref:gamma-glutamyltransferase n=1 Tax=Paenibacillus xylanexedens TaxID=528191 RepID=UPI0011A2DC1A|nr:gamma-glutamyltransferase [Paenibacillus xylanexedens]
MQNQMPISRGNMVTSPHYLASAVGSTILGQGGNAYDAAISVSAALGVVYPHMTGPGGDAFFLMHDGATGEITGYNGSGRSATGINADTFKSMGMNSIPVRGVLSAITVPGMVDAWSEVWSRYGRLPWAQLLEPAIRYAEKGCPVSRDLRIWLERNEALIMEQASLRASFAPSGTLLQEGELLVQPELASSLRMIQADGRESFYNGELANRLTSAIREDGGMLAPIDFASHKGEWVEPVSTDYRGYEVHQMPPNSQGFSLLMMLNMLEHVDLSSVPRTSPEFYHLVTEVVKKVFRDRDRYLTDPDFRDIPLDRLLSKGYGHELWSEIHTLPPVAQPFLSKMIGQDTAYAAVVDQEGNAVSFIQSLYFDFGSAYVPGDTGIIMQNRGSFFSLNSLDANVLEPGKRTFHTLMPGLVTHHGKPYMLLGTQGGEGQPQTQISIITGVIDYGLTIQEAINLPRWLYGRTWGEKNDQLRVENRYHNDVCETLTAWGHKVEVRAPWDDVMGQSQGIVIRADGMISGAADPRGDGMAIGW